ncbi:MAG: hypothetical protein LAT78_10170, partial [Roseinatronobacter sp.]|nr:hypothetical protein [Roseinatronobacter sp.]
LAVYGLSMTLPFIFAALFARPFLDWVARNRARLAHVEKVMGVILVAFDVLIATDSVALIAEAKLDWAPWFATLGLARARIILPVSGSFAAMGGRALHASY